VELPAQSTIWTALTRRASLLPIKYMPRAMVIRSFGGPARVAEIALSVAKHDCNSGHPDKTRTGQVGHFDEPVIIEHIHLLVCQHTSH
jgi:hypothetical protein